MQRERGPGRHRRPPARLPARNSRLRPRARAGWLRLGASAARTGRPACQSPAGGGGGASRRGGFLFAGAGARNNERRPRPAASRASRAPRGGPAPPGRGRAGGGGGARPRRSLGGFAPPAVPGGAGPARRSFEASSAGCRRRSLRSASAKMSARRPRGAEPPGRAPLGWVPRRPLAAGGGVGAGGRASAERGRYVRSWRPRLAPGGRLSGSRVRHSPPETRGLSRALREGAKQLFSHTGFFQSQ